MADVSLANNPSNQLGSSADKHARRCNKRRQLSARIAEQLRRSGGIELSELFPNAPGLFKTQSHQSGERYAKEYIFQVLHELLLSGVPLAAIARTFCVDVRTVHLWKGRLYERYREDARDVEPGTLVGEVLESYRAMVALGMRELVEADQDDSSRRRNAAMLVLKAQAQMVEFMHLVGWVGKWPDKTT